MCSEMRTFCLRRAWCVMFVCLFVCLTVVVLSYLQSGWMHTIRFWQDSLHIKPSRNIYDLFFFFLTASMKKKQKQEPIKTTCFLKGEAGLLFFCLFDAVVIYHHALTPRIVARHMLHYLLPFFFPPPSKSKTVDLMQREGKRNHPQISFFWGNQLLNYKSRWCLTLTQSRGRSCEEIHQRLISEKKEKKKPEIFTSVCRLLALIQRLNHRQ